MYIDKTMLIDFIAGDPRAFKSIYDMYHGKVYRFVLGFIKDEDAAKDIVQTVFIKLWEKRVLIENVNNLDAYILGITKNSIYRYIKSVVSRYDMETEPVIDDTVCYTTPQDDLEASDLRLAVALVVSGMPPQRKAIFLMSRKDGIGNDEIAERLGITKKTVENHLNLALRAIRAVLGAGILIMSFSVNILNILLGVTGDFIIII